MTFPVTRMRRLRKTEQLRSLVRETSLHISDLIYPLFVMEGTGIRQEISSMPGQYRLSVDELLREAEEALALGIPGLILFGIPKQKDAIATEGYAENGIIQKAVRALKQRFSELIVLTDVCLCEYTDHGHCGVVADREVDNDQSLVLLQKVALSHAQAGADVVAPSDMMDGRVGAIRHILDTHGYSHIPILSYAVKYASAFYGPFREAADSAPQFGDRRSYQMDPANGNEALLEAKLDIEEGADWLMVKPALPYLDIIYRVKQATGYPLAAYHVSGEYAMIMAAAKAGWIHGPNVAIESLTAIKRAGADVILTYFAKQIAPFLR